MPGARGDRLRQGTELGHRAGRREGYALQEPQRSTDVQQHHARDRQRAGVQAWGKVCHRRILGARVFVWQCIVSLDI